MTLLAVSTLMKKEIESKSIITLVITVLLFGATSFTRVVPSSVVYLLLLELNYCICHHVNWVYLGSADALSAAFPVVTTGHIETVMDNCDVECTRMTHFTWLTDEFLVKCKSILCQLWHCLYVLLLIQSLNLRLCKQFTHKSLHIVLNVIKTVTV